MGAIPYKLPEQLSNHIGYRWLSARLQYQCKLRQFIYKRMYFSHDKWLHEFKLAEQTEIEYISVYNDNNHKHAGCLSHFSLLPCFVLITPGFIMRMRPANER